MSNSPLLHKVDFCFLIAFCFMSCARPPEEKTFAYNKMFNAKVTDIDAVLLQHTKHADIPVPVGFKPRANQAIVAQQTDTYALSYSGNLTVEQSIAFYKQGMEINGWEIQNFSIGQEGLFFCTKASKRCALSIRHGERPSPHKTTVSMFIQADKQQQASYEPDDIINKKNIDL